MLDLAFICIGHSDAGYRFGVRASLPHFGDVLPVARIVLHFRPDEVVAGVRHGAVSGGIRRGEDRSARYLLALHHLNLHRIPDLTVGGSVEVWPYFHVFSSIRP